MVYKVFGYLLKGGLNFGGGFHFRVRIFTCYHLFLIVREDCTIVREGEWLRKMGDFDFSVSVEGLGDEKVKDEKEG